MSLSPPQEAPINASPSQRTLRSSSSSLLLQSPRAELAGEETDPRRVGRTILPECPGFSWTTSGGAHAWRLLPCRGASGTVGLDNFWGRRSDRPNDPADEDGSGPGDPGALRAPDSRRIPWATPLPLDPAGGWPPQRCRVKALVFSRAAVPNRLGNPWGLFRRWHSTCATNCPAILKHQRAHRPEQIVHGFRLR